MSAVPVKTTDKIAFFESRLPGWQTNATALGSTAAVVTDLQAKTGAARAALDAQVAAQNAAKAATDDLRLAVFAMGRAGTDFIYQVRSQAGRSGDGVYTLAQLPVPGTPAPVGPPGTPTDVKVALDGNGALILTWKCPNPRSSAGTIYQIFRRIGASGEFVYVGGAGAKKFVDAAVPAGATQLTYQIQAVRSTAVGLYATFNVNFGTNAGGVVTASVAESPMKIAA